MHSGTFSAINGGTFFRGFDSGVSQGFDETDDEEEEDVFEPASSPMAGRGEEEEMWGGGQEGLELGMMRGGAREWDESPTLGMDSGSRGRTLSLGEVTRRAVGV